MPTATRRPSIFLSHTHTDKPFVRRLAADLEEAGARVWVDEAEILVGDSLIEKIEPAIGEMDYFAVVLTPRSVGSEWVRTELEIAVKEQMRRRGVTVLPLLLETCEIPETIKGTAEADFRGEASYDASLAEILRRLDLVPDDTRIFERLLKTHPLLAAAWESLEGPGVAQAVMGAMLTSSIPAVDQAAFWRIAAGRVEGEKLVNLAGCAVALVDAHGVGHEAFEACLEEGRLTPDQRARVGIFLLDVQGREAVIWAHRLLVNEICVDAHYHTFFHRHASVVLEACRDEMAAYVLIPDRGPLNCNVDTICAVIEKADDPEPFLQRWIDWINDGRFDGNRATGDETAEILYEVLTDARKDGATRLEPVVQAVHDRVCMLLKSRDNAVKGLYHLVSMIQAEYAGAGEVLADMRRRVSYGGYSKEEFRLLGLLQATLRILAAVNEDPGNRELKQRFEDKAQEIADVDRITGFWRGSDRRFDA